MKGGRGGGGKEQEGEGKEATGGCLLLNLSLAISPSFACDVCQFIVRGAGLCSSCIFNPKTFTVSHVVTPKASLAQASHQLNPALV